MELTIHRRTDRFDEPEAVDGRVNRFALPFIPCTRALRSTRIRDYRHKGLSLRLRDANANPRLASRRVLDDEFAVFSLFFFIFIFRHSLRAFPTGVKLLTAPGGRRTSMPEPRSTILRFKKIMRYGQFCAAVSVREHPATRRIIDTSILAIRGKKNTIADATIFRKFNVSDKHRELIRTVESASFGDPILRSFCQNCRASFFK